MTDSATDQPQRDTSLEEHEDQVRTDIRDIGRALTTPAARRGLITLVAGITALAWPQVTTVAIVGVVAAALLFIGASEVWSGIRTGLRPTDWARSALMATIGLAILVFRRASFRWIAIGLAAILIGRGVIDVVGAVRSNDERSDRQWRALRGAAQILVGAITALSPRPVVLTIIAAFALAWIAAGLINLIHALNDDPADDAPISARDTPQAVVDWLRGRDMGAEGRDVVVEKLIFEGPALHIRVARFVALMLFSTAIATFGVQADSTAVVIGAMLIAPLMTPIMATAASLIMGWPGRALRSLALVGSGVGLAIGASWIFSRYSPELVAVTANSQVLSRVSPTLLDLLVALAAGGAGAYAVSRTDISDSLPGVAIAVALVPPLTVVGVSLQAGLPGFAAGAFLLFLTNLVGIVLAAGVVFVLVGFSPWFHLEANQDQVNRSFAVVAVALLIIAIPLWVTGDRIVAGATRQTTVEEAVEAWLGDASPYTVARVNVDGDTVAVVVVGVGGTLEADTLARHIAAELDTEIELDLRVIPEERTIVTAVPPGT